MRMLITTAALLIFGSVATAQTGGTGSSTTTPASSSQSNRDAPVGHRQPRANQLPPEKNQDDPNDPLARENAALDRKIKGICRGC